MGVIENGTQELESHGIGDSKTSENLNQNPNCDHLTSDNCESNFEPVVTETREQKEVMGAQNIENKLDSMEESSNRIKEVGPDSANIYPNPGAETRESQLENVTKTSALQNAEVPPQNEMENFKNTGLCPGSSLSNPDNGKLEPMRKDANNDLDHMSSEDRGTAEQTRKRKAKLKSPVTSSWSLRSKSQEKPKAPEPDNNVKEVSANGEKKKRGRKKGQKNKNNANEFLRTRKHLRYLFHRINYEQSLIDAYSAEGWKGQSLEKLKPEKELQRAKSHIIRYKLKIRELFQRLDSSLAAGKLPESLFDSKGEIDSEDIFCAKCGSKDVPLDNDIILCDGVCERGFHQFCLEPPLLKEDIPEGDEGWLCPGCDCKLDCIDILKDFQGTAISLADSWEKIFPEAAAAASGKQLDDGSGSSSDDSEDDDYDPDKPDVVGKAEGEESGSDESTYFSASEAASPKNEKYLGLSSDESEDDDFDPMAPDPEKQVKQDSSSSDFTSDSEDLAALLDDATAPDEEPSSISIPSHHTGSKEKNPKVGRMKRQSTKDELSYLMEDCDEPMSSKRHVERLDYKKLNDETYGNSSSESSDEDFVDTTASKRGKRNRKNISPNKTPITKGKMENGGEKQEESQNLTKRTRKNVANGASNESATKVGSASSGTKRTPKRLGEAVTQRLYQSFNQNQYPEKAVKENLANELGLTIQQVTKWFENARWSFHHRPRMEKLNEKPPESQPTTAAESSPFSVNVEMQESVAIPTSVHIGEVRVENLVSGTDVENSGKGNLRKRKGEIDPAQDDHTVPANTHEGTTPGDLQSPQLRSSKRRTRSNNSVA